MREDRPSSTAVLIAAEVALLSRDPRVAPLIAPEAGRLSRGLVSAISPTLARVLACANRACVRGAARLIEGCFLRGLMLHHVVRKRWIEDEVMGALRTGFRQVVVVGAGLDTLALRLSARFPGATFIEVDHPATQHAKLAALPRAWSRRANLGFVPADLSRTRLDDALAWCPLYNPLERLLFIAEGLLMYLEPARVESLLASARGPTGAVRRFIFSFVAPQPGRAADFPRATRLLRAWLRWKGEPFRWGVSTACVRDWMAERGFEAREIAGASELRRRYMLGTPAADEPLAEGEWLCRADASGLRPSPEPVPAGAVVG